MAATSGNTRRAGSDRSGRAGESRCGGCASGCQLTAAEQRAVPGLGARLVTTLTRHPGGASVQVHARIDESFTLVYDALVARGGAEAVLPAAVGAGTAVASAVAPPAGAFPSQDPRIAAIEGGEDLTSDTLETA